MPAASTARRLLLLGVVAALLTGAFATGSASAASADAGTADPAPLTICPTLGTVAVVTRTGESSCVQNDCAAIATATTGSTAACEGTASRSQTVMDTAPAPTPIVAATRTPGQAAPLAPAAALSTTALIIRSLIGIGIGALLLVGALLLGGRRTRRQEKVAAARSTTAA